MDCYDNPLKAPSTKEKILSAGISSASAASIARSGAAARRPLRAAFFGYSWLRSGELNGYMMENLNAIRQLGVDVDLYLGNYFVAKRGTQGFSTALSRKRLASYIRSREYDFAISFNNSLIFSEVVDALNCKIVSVLVDSEQHLFDHDERGPFSAFDLDMIIAPIFSSLEQDLRARHPSALPRFHFIPPATCVGSAPQAHDVPPTSISWIASLVGDSDLDHFAKHISESAADADVAILCLEKISRSGYLDKLRDDGKVRKLARNLSWDMGLLEIHLQNIVTNSQRVSVVEKLSARGLRLYGNPRWAALIPNSLAVAKSLVPQKVITSHFEQMSVYNESKISINLPQIQAKTGLQYRVLDIMASRALLVTKFIADSDLEKIFGRDHTIPTFKDESEMIKIVDHYLNNERDRFELVNYCNDLLKKGFSFVERMLDYLGLSNPSRIADLPLADVSSEYPTRLGCVAHVMHGHFTNWTGLR